MKKLDLFLLKSFFGPFVMTFFITVFILVMQFLWLYIDELVGKGLSFWVIMEFLGWGSATILPLAMPLATLLASIMTFGNLGENNELLAMKAARNITAEDPHAADIRGFWHQYCGILCFE